MVALGRRWRLARAFAEEPLQLPPQPPRRVNRWLHKVPPPRAVDAVSMVSGEALAEGGRRGAEGGVRRLRLVRPVPTGRRGGFDGNRAGGLRAYTDRICNFGIH